MKDHYNVLFLCTGNSARSIMAEAILNFKGKPRFTAYSAGSHPSGVVRREALERLETARISTQGLRSKSWEEFAKPGAPNLDFVFTVCDNAAKEVCPVWPGQPMTAHWGVPDPAAADGSEMLRRQAFRDAFLVLENRIKIFTSLQPEKLDRLSLKRRLDEIGRVGAIKPAGAAPAP
jgi:arsenate reductase (thioredoxin)